MPLQIDSELPRSYYEGDFCPIEFGDRIADRFTVLHKLGYGSYAAVWLVRDDEERHGRYVALKVVCADHSHDYVPTAVVSRLEKYKRENGFPGLFVFELEHVFHTSRNGQHLCQILPVLGPNLSSFNKWGDSEATRLLYPSFVKDFTQQLTTLLGIAHSLGVCYGSESLLSSWIFDAIVLRFILTTLLDVTIKNVAIRLDKSLDSLTEQQLSEIFGKMRTGDEKLRGRTFGRPYLDESIKWYFQDMEQSPAPAYAVETVDLTLLPPEYLTSNVCIFDYDCAFLTEDPPKRLAYIEYDYLAPESIFTLTNGPEADVWALGCIPLYLRRPMLPFRDCQLSSGDPKSTC